MNIIAIAVYLKNEHENKILVHSENKLVQIEYILNLLLLYIKTPLLIYSYIINQNL